MTEDELKRQAIDLHDRYTHGGLDRRAFLGDLAKLAGSAAAANALMLTIAADPARAAVIAPDDKRLATGNVSWTTAPGRTMRGYRAAPRRGRKPRGSVIVIHENRGLNEYIRDVARRVALAGFTALAPDFLSPLGGTPADENAARQMIGKLDAAATLRDAVATVDWLHPDTQSSLSVGAVGFCWGGGLVNKLATATPLLAAGVPFYGPAPAPAQAARVRAAMLLHYAANDARVNDTAQPWIAALKAARAPVEAHFYAGTEHAFHNDTSAARYDKAAADLAWARTLAHFRKHLG